MWKINLPRPSKAGHKQVHAIEYQQQTVYKSVENDRVTNFIHSGISKST